MTRRTMLFTVGGGTGVAAASYAWRERRGVTRADFPPEVASGQVTSLLTYAALAPSGHNTQPWSVQAIGNELLIGSDRSRWLPKVDPANREMGLSIGAFLENLLVACPSHGFRGDYQVIGTGPSDADLIRVRLVPIPEASRGVLESLRLRRTVRSGQSPKVLPARDAFALTGFFEGHAHFVSPASREGRYLAEGTIEANRVQALRDDAQTELASWIRFSNGDARRYRDGLTQESMEISGAAGWYVRHFMDRQSVMSSSFRKQGVDRVRQQVASCGGWIIVTSPDGTLASLVETGRRAERMWLTVRDHQIAIHPMTQMLEEAPFREQIGKELGMANPIQFVLRVGYVPKYPPPVSLRRPASMVLRS